MKLYLANEAKLTAKNVNTKTHKSELESLMGEAMYVITEAAKRGDFELELEQDYSSDKVRTTFMASLRELGYNVSDAEDYLLVKWG